MEDFKKYYSVEGRFDRYGEQTQFFVGVYSERPMAVESAEKTAGIFGHSVNQHIGAAKWVEQKEIDRYNNMDVGREMDSTLRWEGKMGCGNTVVNAYLEIGVFKIPIDKIPETTDDFIDVDVINEANEICSKC